MGLYINVATLKQLHELSDARKKVLQSVIHSIKQTKPKTRSDAMHLAKAHAAIDAGQGILATYHLKMIGELVVPVVPPLDRLFGERAVQGFRAAYRGVGEQHVHEFGERGPVVRAKQRVHES